MADASFGFVHIDGASVIWQGIGSAAYVWTAAIAANPWPHIVLAAVIFLGLLIPAIRWRRRF